MAGDSSKTNSPLGQKMLAAETNTLKHALDGSAFVRCEACNKDVPAALIDLHGCSVVDPKIITSLEAQVVEKPAPRNTAVSSNPNERQAKKSKASSSSAPKRSPTAFFLFTDEFRKTFKEADPDSRTVYAVLKEGVGKWKSMTDEEKKPYVREAELKAECEKAMVKLNEDNEEEIEEENKESEKEEE